MDVAGGQGSLLAAILAQHPGIRGTLCDQPSVIKPFEEAGRAELLEGNLFEALPPGQAPLRPDDEELPQAGEEEASVALEAAASKEPVWPGEKPGERRPFYEVKLP